MSILRFETKLLNLLKKLKLPSLNETCKINSYPKKRKNNRTRNENNDVEYTSFRSKIIEGIGKTEAICMTENLAKVKIKKSQEKYLSFANLTME